MCLTGLVSNFEMKNLPWFWINLRTKTEKASCFSRTEWFKKIHQYIKMALFFFKNWFPKKAIFCRIFCMMCLTWLLHDWPRWGEPPPADCPRERPAQAKNEGKSFKWLKKKSKLLVSNPFLHFFQIFRTKSSLVGFKNFSSKKSWKCRGKVNLLVLNQFLHTILCLIRNFQNISYEKMINKIEKK